MALIPANTPVKFARFRHIVSGILAVAGTFALSFMAFRQYNAQTVNVQDLWFLGLMVAITFEALANFFRPTSVGPKITIWSLTLMGCSCVFGGFAMKHGAVLVLGGAMIAGGYAMAVFIPNAIPLDPNAAPQSGDKRPGTSDNAAR
jgi:hypothetical protein